MSFYDYKRSRDIEIEDYPFNSIIMAAMRKADDNNLFMLKRCWPDVWRELATRYLAPGGLLLGEESSAPVDEEDERR